MHNFGLMYCSASRFKRGDSERPSVKHHVQQYAASSCREAVADAGYCEKLAVLIFKHSDHSEFAEQFS